MPRVRTEDDILDLLDENADFEDLPSDGESVVSSSDSDEDATPSNGSVISDRSNIPDDAAAPSTAPTTPAAGSSGVTTRATAGAQRRVRPLPSSDSEGDSGESNLDDNHQNQNVNNTSKWVKSKKPDPAPPFVGTSGPAQFVKDIQDPTPYDLCKLFICDDMVSDIVFQTNLYAQQSGKRYVATNENEIRTFLGINLLMGIKRLPSYRDYWSSAPDLHDDYISKLMTVNRFGWLLSNIHLNDNLLMPSRDDPGYDKLYKLRPFLDRLQENFIKCYTPECVLTVDESMIKFKGRSSLKQYLPKKPIKRGYKVWMCACKSAYVWKFEVYTGRKGNTVQKNLGESVVLNFMNGLEGCEHQVFCDSYFTSYPLMTQLKQKQIHACGTVNISRKGLPSFKNPKKMKRGEHDWLCSAEGIAAVVWMDSRPVRCLTNFIDPEVKEQVNRKARNGQTEKVDCPLVISTYSKNMNCVDRFDHLKSLYEIDRKCKKWWQRIFFFFIDVAVVNAFIIYKALGMPILSMKAFRRQVITGFVSAALMSTKRKTPNASPMQIKKHKPFFPEDVRRKESAHQPIRSTRRRCALCSTKKKQVRTDWACSVCNVPLCLGKSKSCFQQYHQ